MPFIAKNKTTHIQYITMNKAFYLTLTLLLSFLCTPSLHASEKELKSILNEKELKRIESAEKLITKGDSYIKETVELEKEVKSLQNADGRIKTRKINKYNKKIAEVKTKAALYYQDGYKKYIDVLDGRLKDIEKSGNSEAKQTRDDIKALEKKARKQYNKAENMSSPEKVIELLELAQSNQQKAIELQTASLISLSEIIEPEAALIAEEPIALDSTTVEPLVIEEPVTETSDSIMITTSDIAEMVTPAETPVSTATFPTTTVSTAAIATAAIATPTDSVIVVDTPVVESPQETITEPVVIEETTPVNPDVFLTIQILADKKQATAAQLSSLYNGDNEVIEMNVNDWYKYSVGKFQDLDKAKANMKAEGIKGFIVAYNKNQRISVKEAVTLLNGES